MPRTHMTEDKGKGPGEVIESGVEEGKTRGIYKNSEMEESSQELFPQPASVGPDRQSD